MARSLFSVLRPAPERALLALAATAAALVAVPVPAAGAGTPAQAPTRPPAAGATVPVPCGGAGTAGIQLPSQFISSVQFANSQVGWAVGAEVWATRNGGVTWSRQSTAGGDLSGLDVLDPAHAWVYGVEYPSVAFTTDGGVHWSQLPEPPEQLDSLHFVSPTTGFAVAGGSPASASGMPQCGGVLLTTSDGGRLWRQLPSPANVQSACFSNREDGWLSAGVADHADIYRSTDGGHSWARAFTPPLGRTALSSGAPAAALAQLECAGDAVWVLYTGFGAEMNQEPWFAYRGSARGWQPVFSEGYAEPELTVHFPHNAPAGYFGPFSALGPDRAVFVGADRVSLPISAAVDLASAGGKDLHRVGVDRALTTPTGVAFTSTQRGWLVGEEVTRGCSDSTGPLCPWVIDRTVNGGRTWTRALTYRP